MSDLKPKSERIKIGKEYYGLRFTLNAIDQIQDHFDIPISELGSLMEDERTSFKAIRYILTVLINEDAQIRGDQDEVVSTVDEMFVGRNIDVKNMEEITNTMLRSFVGSLPETEGEEEIPNVVSE